MKKLIFLSIVASLLIGCSQKENRVEYADYPIQSVPFSDVILDDGFWKPRIIQNQEVTIPIAINHCYKTGRVENFKKAAAILKGDTIGYFNTEFPFDDTDIYKILEGMSYSYKQQPSQVLKDSMDVLIKIVASAQEPDGYLYTPRTAGEPNKLHAWVGPERWNYDPDLSHELYNSGHLFEAAAAHYQATGTKDLLNIATKNADLLVEKFLKGGLAYEPGHQIVEMGLVKLYRVTGKQDYLKLAKYFLDIRGINGPGSKNNPYYQSHMPPTKQREVVGHAVRAAYMYSGMADVAAIMRDSSYLLAIDSLWENMVSKKYYITGGIGARHEGEAFGKNYELPNLTAYNETCAAIANVYWNWRLFLLHGDAKYYDVLERTLYNAVLSGISLTGDHFFYPNPLASKGGYNRSEWFGCACCPSNLCRFMASIPGYFYASCNDSIYVNLFAQGSTNIQTNEGYFTISQKTNYPWDGKIEISIDSVPVENNMTLKIRRPGWSKNTPVPSDLYSYETQNNANLDVFVNGEKVNYVESNGYITLTRTWNACDVVSFTLPMEVRRVKANPEVEDDINKIALERGPIVYCLEGVDNPDVFEAYISKEDNINAVLDSTTFSATNTSVVALEIANRYKAIPYFSWNNRGDNTMNVWLKCN